MWKPWDLVSISFCFSATVVTLGNVTIPHLGKAAHSGAGERVEAWLGNCLYIADLCKNSLFQGRLFLVLSHSPNSEFEKDGALLCDTPSLHRSRPFLFLWVLLLGWTLSVTLLGLDYPAKKVNSGCEVLH